jgi:hypothetical protein
MFPSVLLHPRHCCSTNDNDSVNPLYYVTFTTGTICASFTFYGGFNTTEAVGTLSLLSGFFITFAGVYLLNLSREPRFASVNLGGSASQRNSSVSSLPRFNGDGHRSSVGSAAGGDREGLMRAFNADADSFELDDLAEEESNRGETSRALENNRQSKPRGR